MNYKTTVANIKSLNGLSSDIIKVGQKLKVNGTSNTPVTQTPVQQSGKLKGKKITIDPGHGGKFPGAQGIVHEEDINLQIAFKLRDALKSQGATVIMTRTSDVHLASDRPSDLVARAKMSSGSDMFISIHGNAGTSTASGTEVYWYKGNGNSLASSIVKEISKETGLRNRGAKHADFSVLRNSGNQSVLVETAFVTNKNDAALLGSKSGQDKIVKGITKGILNYLGK